MEYIKLIIVIMQTIKSMSHIVMFTISNEGISVLGTRKCGAYWNGTTGVNLKCSKFHT